MNAEPSVRPLATNVRHDLFRDIFQRTLNQRSNSRPPKMELTGILIPAGPSESSQRGLFKLETDQSEYRLKMGANLCAVARKLEWEEVTVKGDLDPNGGIFEVEKISLTCKPEPDRVSLAPVDLLYEIDHYKKTIARKGMLDVSPDYAAS